MDFSKYIGQETIKPLITKEVEHSIKTNTQLRHIGFYGQPGIGKTSLAKLIAENAGYIFHPMTGGKEWTEVKVSSFLLSLSVKGYNKNGTPSPGCDRHLIFIDEVHRIPSGAFEAWYKPLEECHIDKGGSESWLPFFTMVAATTDPTLLPKPFRDRIDLPLVLKSYSIPELQKIVQAKVSLSSDEALEVAKRARGVARVAVKMATSVKIHGVEYFDRLGIDDRGLNDLDRAYLKALETGTKSLTTLAATIGQTPEVLTSLIEPYLKELGLIEISGRGRNLTGSGSRGRRATDELLDLYT